MTLQGSTLEEFASLLCRIVSLELFALALHSAYKKKYIYTPQLKISFLSPFHVHMAAMTAEMVFGV